MPCGRGPAAACWRERTLTYPWPELLKEVLLLCRSERTGRSSSRVSAEKRHGAKKENKNRNSHGRSAKVESEKRKEPVTPVPPYMISNRSNNPPPFSRVSATGADCYRKIPLLVMLLLSFDECDDATTTAAATAKLGARSATKRFGRAGLGWV